ncbi:MAG: hypothetical protein LBL16_03650 [Endomicrobium sp.]|nr:hypothetical protein [Endomicrobium sp.]
MLKIDNSFKSPAGILGTICISVGLIYTFFSFISNVTRENYQSIIQEYKSSSGVINKRYIELVNKSSSGPKDKKEYTEITDDGTNTQTD